MQQKLKKEHNICNIRNLKATYYYFNFVIISLKKKSVV